MEHFKTCLGNFISDVRYHGRHVIPDFIDRPLSNLQFRLFGLKDLRGIRFMKVDGLNTAFFESDLPPHPDLRVVDTTGSDHDNG